MSKDGISLHVPVTLTRKTRRPRWFCRGLRLRPRGRLRRFPSAHQQRRKSPTGWGSSAPAPSPFRRDCNGGCSGSRMRGICTRVRASSCSAVDRMGTFLSRTHSQTFTLTCKHDHSHRHQTRRPSFTQDMLGALVQLSVVGGGPNCRPWSILRWFPKRLGGLDANNDQEQKDTDNDSVLLLRQMVITDLAKQPVQGGTYPFLEHPDDPKLRSKSPSAGKCSTIWILPEYRHLATRQAHSRISCDQCVLGQIVTKRTTLSTNLDLNHWHDIRCKHPAHALPEGTT